MKRILLFLEHTQTTRWIIIDEQNQIIHSIANVNISELVITEEYEIFVFVPTEDVLLTSAQLPKLSRGRMLQALPFALEEQLIEDVAQLHFAMGEYQADGSIPVAVVSSEKMTAWLAMLAEHNLKPRAFIPSIFILPFAENHWHINSDHQHCLVRTGKFSGFACEKENLETLLQLKLAEEPNHEPIEKIEKIQLIRTQLSELHLLETRIHDILISPAINLLQGSFQPKLQTTQVKKNWLIACYLAVAVIGLGFFGNLISFFILHHAANKTETAINTIYYRNFPQAKSVVAPRNRMTEKLRKITGQASKNNALALLSNIGKSLTDTKGVDIKNFDFREQQLTLEIIAATFDNLDAFTKSLTQQGLSVKQQNAAIIGAQVKATLLIRAGTS